MPARHRAVVVFRTDRSVFKSSTIVPCAFTADDERHRAPLCFVCGPLGTRSLSFDLRPGATVGDVVGHESRCFPAPIDCRREPLVAVNERYAQTRSRTRGRRRDRDHSARRGRLMRHALSSTRRSMSSALLAEVANSANGATMLFPRHSARRERWARRDGHGVHARTERWPSESSRTIVREAAERFGTRDIVVEHRLGALALGEASVAIAVAHPHRGRAYDASRYVIEQLKRRVPIWKLEHYVDGTREWVDAGNAHRPSMRWSALTMATDDRRAEPGAASRTPALPTNSGGDRVSAHLGHRSLQFPLRVLHARERAWSGCPRRAFCRMRRSPTSSRQLAPLGFADCESPAVSRRSVRKSTS